MFLHGEFSADDCARELFKPSKDSPSLRVCSVKKILGFGFFVSDVISGVVLGQWHWQRKIFFWVDMFDFRQATVFCL